MKTRSDRGLIILKVIEFFFYQTLILFCRRLYKRLFIHSFGIPIYKYSRLNKAANFVFREIEPQFQIKTARFEIAKIRERPLGEMEETIDWKVLRDDLNAKLNDLKLLVQCPAYCIDKHFSSMINLVDTETEEALINFSHDQKKQKSINSTRDELLIYLKRQEKLLADNREQPAFQDIVRKNRELLSFAQDEIETICPKNGGGDLDLFQYKNHYQKLAVQLFNEKLIMEKEVFSNQTYLYYPPRNPQRVQGTLVHFKDLYFNSIETQFYK